MQSQIRLLADQADHPGTIEVMAKHCTCLDCWGPPEDFDHGITQQNCPNCTHPMNTNPDLDFAEAICPACGAVICLGTDPDQTGWEHKGAES